MAAEKQFENKVKAYLKEQGCWFVKYWSGSSINGMKFTKDGIPDLLVCCNGYFIGIELKAPKGTPTELQLWNCEQIRKAGGIAMVLYPNQFEEFKLMIKKLKERKKDNESV